MCLHKYFRAPSIHSRVYVMRRQSSQEQTEKEKSMSIERVKEYFLACGIESRIQEFSASSATVGLAAELLGCEPCRIAKTLSFTVNGPPYSS